MRGRLTLAAALAALVVGACTQPQGLAHPKPGTIDAFDGATGALRWTTKSLPAGPGLLTAMANRLLVEGASSCGAAAGDLDTFDRVTGKPAWATAEQAFGYPGVTRGGPADGGRAIVVVADFREIGVTAPPPDTAPGGSASPPSTEATSRVRGLDAVTGAAIWSIPLDASSVVQAGALAVARSESEVIALDVATGRIVWRVAGQLGPGGAVIAGSTVAVPVRTGRGQQVVGPPDRILGQVVEGLDVATGQLRWTVPTAMGQVALAGSEGVVVIEEPGAPQPGDVVGPKPTGSGAGNAGPPMGPAALRAIDVATGATRWTVDLNGAGRMSESDVAELVVADGLAVTPLGQGQVGAFALGDGSRRWTASVAEVGNDPRNVRSLSIGDGRVVVGAGSKVTALDAGSGRVEWQRHLGEVGAVLSGTTVFAAGNGALAHCTPD